MSSALAVRLYDLSEGPSDHVFPSAPYVATPAELVKCSLAAALIAPLAWVTLGGVACISQHINILEAHAGLFYIRWLIRRGTKNCRLIVIDDSGVVKGSV